MNPPPTARAAFEGAIATVRAIAFYLVRRARPGLVAPTLPTLRWPILLAACARGRIAARSGVHHSSSSRAPAPFPPPTVDHCPLPPPLRLVRPRPRPPPAAFPSPPYNPRPLQRPHNALTTPHPTPTPPHPTQHVHHLPFPAQIRPLPPPRAPLCERPLGHRHHAPLLPSRGAPGARRTPATHSSAGRPGRPGPRRAEQRPQPPPDRTPPTSPMVDPFDCKAYHPSAQRLCPSHPPAPPRPPQIRGKENLPGPNDACVYVANHQSYLDIFSLFHLRRPFKARSVCRPARCTRTRGKRRRGRPARGRNDGS